MRKEYNRNKKKLKKNNRKEKVFKVIKNILLYGIVTAVVIGVGLFGYMYKEYKPMLQEIYDNAMLKIDGIDKKDFKDKSNSIIYYGDGSEMKQLNLNDFYYLDYKDIPSDVEDALLSIEDIRYYEHPGVDIKAIARAGYVLVKNKGEIKQGGSTITQQLVKLKFLTLEKSYERKLEEVIIAYNLEKKFNKTEILEFYLNMINYGNGAYGIESASQIYFSKSAKDLTLSQVAFLTGVPNNPTLYSPINNFDNALKRRNLILSKMLEYGKITESEYSLAIKEEIVLDLTESKYEPDSYDVSFIISSASKEIMKQNDFEFKYWFDSAEERKEYLENYNLVFKEAEHIVRNSGFKIYSTIDKEKQSLLQETINNGLKDYQAKDSASGLYKTQASGVSIDNEKGELVAIVGGRTQDDIANTYNRAFLSFRQPGSTIKPLVAYLPALERGVLSTNTFSDTKEKKGPDNVDFKYRGNLTVREAVERSVNTIPFKLMNSYGAREMLTYLEGMEFSGLDYRDNNNSTSIGGFTYGTNTYEMANAYYTIVNNGEYVRMTGIRQIVDKYGDIYYEDKKEGAPVYDSGTSYLMTDILKGVLTEKHGTANKFQLKRTDIESAAKTGTTNGRKDLWFIGYTPYYTTSVWMGNDTPATLEKGNKYVNTIWKTYMDKIHEGLDVKTFKVPNRVLKAYVNPKTGEVSEKEKKGWIYQWVTANYLEKLSAENSAKEAKNRAAEIARQQKEKEEKERIAKERAKELSDLGMTEADAENELAKGKEILKELIYLDIVEVGDYDAVVIPLLKKMNENLKVIKFKPNYNKLKAIYDEESNRLLNKKKKLDSIKLEEQKAEVERAKELEAKAKEEDEKIKAEEEARIKAEVEAILKEEEAKRLAEEKERKAIEEKAKAEEKAKEEAEKEKENIDKGKENNGEIIETPVTNSEGSNN